MSSGDVRYIVYVSTTKVHPANTGGFAHTTGIARALARAGHRVLIYSPAGRRSDYRLGGPRRLRIEPEAGVTEIVHLGLTSGLAQTVNRRLGYPRRWQYEFMRRGWVPAELKRELAKADLVLADGAMVPRIAGARPGVPWVLVSHNLEWRLLEQGTARERGCAAWMRQVEAAAPQQFDEIFACTTEDRDFFREHAGGRTLRLPIVGSGVDAARYRRDAGARRRLRAELGLGEQDHLLVFAASGAWQNRDALGRLKGFVEREGDFLRARRLWILLLGMIEPKPYRQGPLIATGPVDAAEPYFSAADGGLNPVTKGSGANVKTYEYMAARLPVVSTRFGMRGSGLQPDVDYLAFENDGELRHALERFIGQRDRQQWREFAEALWQREVERCDIDTMVRLAFEQRPDFGVGFG